MSVCKHDYHDNTVVKHVFLASTIVCQTCLPCQYNCMSVCKDYHDNKVVKHVFLASTIVCLYVRTTMTIRLSNMSSLPVQLYVCM